MHTYILVCPCTHGAYINTTPYGVSYIKISNLKLKYDIYV